MFSDHLLCHLHVSSSSPSFGLLLFCSKGTTERKLIHQQELGVSGSYCPFNCIFFSHLTAFNPHSSILVNTVKYTVFN